MTFCILLLSPWFCKQPHQECENCTPQILLLLLLIDRNPLPSLQGRSVRWTLTSVRAALVTMEAPASTNQTASPVTVHLGGWGPAVRSVSQPARKPAFSYSSHMRSSDMPPLSVRFFGGVFLSPS